MVAVEYQNPNAKTCTQDSEFRNEGRNGIRRDNKVYLVLAFVCRKTFDGSREMSPFFWREEDVKFYHTKSNS